MTKIPLPNELIFLARLFREAGVCLYAVGGVVRDQLLGLQRSDVDVTSAMSPEAVLELCRAHDIRCIPKALHFGTVEIHLPDGVSVEHTTFRSEHYGAGGAHRPDAVTLHSSLEADAFRRDFSVNALYYDILEEKLVDPTGGLADLTKRLLRTTSTDAADILCADGLRIMRLVRLSSELGFTVENQTWETARAHVGLLNDIAWERKRDEFLKILRSDERLNDRSAVLTALYRLDALGAFDLLLPELSGGRYIHQTPKHHAFNVLEHSFHVCVLAPTRLRFAALLHDVGKPEAFRRSGGRPDAAVNWRAAGLKKSPMLNHDLIGAEIALDIGKRFRLPNAEIEHISQLVLYHMYDIADSAKESTLRAFFAQRGLPFSLELCDIREADVRGSGLKTQYTAERWRALLSVMQEEGTPFSLSDLRCTGEDIMDWLRLPAGPEIGRILRLLLKHCAQHPKDNTPRRLQAVSRGLVS